MRYKKILILIITVMTLNTASHAFSKDQVILPKGWTIIKDITKKISSSTGEIGQMKKIILKREEKPAKVEIIDMRGKAFGKLYVPQNVSCDDLPIGVGATYRTFLLEGKTSIIETYPYIGTSITVSPEKEHIIKFESKNLEEKELIRFATLYMNFPNQR